MKTVLDPFWSSFFWVWLVQQKPLEPTKLIAWALRWAACMGTTMAERQLLLFDLSLRNHPCLAETSQQLFSCTT